jgi:hypothetical protein
MDLSTIALSPHFKTAVGPTAVLDGRAEAKAGKWVRQFMFGPFQLDRLGWGETPSGKYRFSIFFQQTLPCLGESNVLRTGMNGDGLPLAQYSPSTLPA